MKFRNWLEMDEKGVRRDFSRLPCRPYRGRLYHGTTKEGAACIARNGFSTYYHRELCDYFLSASINPRIVSLFGNSGFEFDVNFDKVLELNRFYYELLAHETGMEGFWDEDEPKLLAKANKLGMKTRFGDYGIGDACSFFHKFLYQNPKFRGVKGIFVPGFDSQHHNAESEIAVTQAGLTVLQNSVTRICIDRQWFDADEGWEYLREIEVDGETCDNVLGGDK